MLQTRDFQTVVIGSGPAGIVAALELSKHSRTALITNHLPNGDECPRIESVPASLLALLIEYGIHPRRIGVDRLHETRLIAWETVSFAENNSAIAAHIERPGRLPRLPTAGRWHPEHPPHGVHRTAGVEGQDRSADGYRELQGGATGRPAYRGVPPHCLTWHPGPKCDQ